MSAQFSADLEQELATLLPQIVELRHDLHRHPELGFEEHRTQGVVRAWLEGLGYSPRDSAGTGLVADLYARDGAPIVALRADLDCLPIEEKTDLPYRSVHSGRSHKCGHDGHTAILMGVAAVLAKHRAELPVNVRLLFQPAEEGVRGGGARVMVAEGALEGVREVYGLHNWPAWPMGQVRVKSGAMLAQVDNFVFELTGVGGHASQPQLCRDPIVAASQLILALQTVVSRGLGWEGGAVLTVASFHAGTANNIIPRTARLEGTLRSFDPAVRVRALSRLREVVAGIASASGVEIAISHEEGYPVVVNDAECTERVRRVAASLVGPGNVRAEALPLAGGEDFAYLCQAVPGAFFFLGAQREGQDTPVCHHPDFDFEDALIPLGMRMFLGLVLDPR